MSDIGSSPIRVLQGVGPARAKAYGKLGIETVSDLLYHFPRAYENRGDVKLLSECVPGNKSAVELVIGTVPKKTMIRRGMVLLKFTAFDESGTCEITFYNQNYLADKFPLGASFRFYGQIEKVGRRYKMNSPAYEMIIEGEELKPLVPVYPLTEGLTKNRISADIAAAMSVLAPEMSDYLPEDIRKRYKLCTLPFAIRNIHDPADYESVARAKKRLVFDEFFTFALGMALSGKKGRESGAPACAQTDLTPLLSSFPYELTGDQQKAIYDIQRDMAKETPMSRILVGDVGCGKTVCAMAAMYIAASNGYQAVLMAPTEILARQHYADIAPVFEKMGYRTELLVGSMTAGEKKRVRASLSNENEQKRAKIVIGTHALISEGVEFHSCGVIVTDEQHRFGVAQRSKLSAKGRDPHVLVMSATPIPRTLNMALSGIRDMSTIEAPPSDRYPVQTFVMEHSNAIIDDAIRREVERGGQVYYLHNRTETIDQCAGALRRRIPGLNVAVAHGQMGEDALGDVMQSMADGDIQVLVCTTIIETGLDIPNANTLIIENADRFGLSQLHQLRGRVGRSTRHAYAYFTYRPDKNLTEVAEKRLSAIRDFAEFGSGFKIAMRDLEIRGAGNLLGAEQSGHMMSVGYDMYLKLLDEAVLEEKGEKLKEPDCTADLNVTANVSQDYVARGEERMDLYRRMAAIRTQEDADDLLDEIIDRYGDPPKGVLNLIDIALLRAEAQKLHICDIRQKAGEVLLTMTEMNFDGISRIIGDKDYAKRIQLVATAKQPTLRLKLASGVDSLRQTKVFLEKYRNCCIQG